MNNTNSIDSNTFSIINKLIEKRDFSTAEDLLNSISHKNGDYYYLYAILFEKKAWFDESLKYFKTAISLCPNNVEYKNKLLNLMSRYKHYSNDYYDSGYRRRNRGCSCCCCDCCDCCDCGNFSCCDLICLDQCCECMGGDLIDCI